MKLSETEKRAAAILAVAAALIIICVIRLIDLQIVNGDEYSQRAENSAVRTYTLKAPRGEIVDRYGVPLVKNNLGYNVVMYRSGQDEADVNAEILDVVKLLKENGDEYNTTFPIVYNAEEEVPEYDFGLIESDYDDREAFEEANSSEIAKWEDKNDLSGYEKLWDIFNHFKEEYGVGDEYSDEDALDIIAVRYEMEQRNFSATNPFTIANDVSDIVVQKIKESYSAAGNVDAVMETIRTYSEGTTAAHILGRTGIIYAEEYEQLKDQGYGMNDIIGKDGLEKVLESYLKGEDGYRRVQITKDGDIGDVVEEKEAVPGNYAELTIDLELQETMESSLEKNIRQACGEGGAGAAIAVDPNNGEVLAIASYPTYDPETFNEDYEELSQMESNPLFNRALNGTYAPGSTFKMLTSIAGLETGTITPETEIVDRGRYTYYSDYQPTCLVYSSSGATHGSINVSEAIGVSCNYFFYELGRLVGIDAIDEYSEKFGLGEATGIELSEGRGQVSSPAEREASGGEWRPGDTLQTAIGQSDSLFTPAQLASYVSAILNKGTRYRLHLIKDIVDYDTDELVYSTPAEVVSDNPISDSTFEAVKDGMRRVTADGTASRVFGSTEYRVGGKTGTAEVSDGADNVLFTGFAPYDEPEIVVAVVIEHGASSSYAAQVAKDIFDRYMELRDTDRTAKPSDDNTDESSDAKQTAAPDEDDENAEEAPSPTAEPQTEEENEEENTNDRGAEASAEPEPTEASEQNGSGRDMII